MAKVNQLIVKETTIRTFHEGEWDYICITDIAAQKNADEPKDVVKNWMRLKNTIEYLGLWEMLNNPEFKGFEFDPLFQAAGTERLEKLNKIAIQQMKILEDVATRNLLKA